MGGGDVTAAPPPPLYSLESPPPLPPPPTFPGSLYPSRDVHWSEVPVYPPPPPPPPPPPLSLIQRVRVGVDTETYKITRGRLAPRLVVLSHARRVRLDSALRREDAFDRQLLLRPEAIAWFERAIRDPSVTLVILNAVFDLGVLCNEAPHLIPAVFDAFRDFRIRCPIVTQKLIDIATGQRKFRRTKPDGSRMSPVPAKYNLADLARYYYDEAVEKDGTWRTSYGLLDGIPLDAWTPKARQYAGDDAVWHLLIDEAQDRFIAQKWGELPNQVEQQRANWALHLMSMWGVRADAKAVDKFVEHCSVEIAKMQNELRDTGIFKPAYVCGGGVKCARIGAEAATRAGLKPAPHGANEPFETCPRCGAARCRANPDAGGRTMKEIQRRVIAACARRRVQVPMTDPSPKFPDGQVKTDKETLEETDDDDLHRLAASMTFVKHLGQWGPVCRAAVHRPVVSRYDVLMETGRTSCVAEGTLVEVHRGGVQVGVPIERVVIGDEVYCYDDDLQIIHRRVLAVHDNGVREVVRVHWCAPNGDAGHVDVTPDHRVRFADGRYARADAVRDRDQLLALARDAVGRRVEVRVEPLGVFRRVLDLTVEGEHNFIAGGVCVHNCSGSEGQEGTNFQNPPRAGDVRPCFIPRRGWLYCSTDADTIELRAQAQNCLEIVGWSKMAEALWDQHRNKGPDLHVRLAANLVGITLEEAHALKQAGDVEFLLARQFAKIPGFGLWGGLGPETLVTYAAAQLSKEMHRKWFGTTRDEQIAKATWVKEVWKATWPEEKQYFKWVNECVKRGWGVQPKSGRIRADIRYTSWANSPFQGRVADAEKDILWQLAEESYTGRCTKQVDYFGPERRPHVHGHSNLCTHTGRSVLYGSRTVMFLHDEPIMEHPEDGSESDRAERQRQIVVDNLQVWMPDVPVTSSAVLMRRWEKGAEPVRVGGTLVPSRPEKFVDEKTGKKKVRWVHDTGEPFLAAAA